MYFNGIITLITIKLCYNRDLRNVNSNITEIRQRNTFNRQTQTHVFCPSFTFAEFFSNFQTFSRDNLIDFYKIKYLC